MKKQLTQCWQVLFVGLVLALGGGRGAWAQVSNTYLYYRFNAEPTVACLGQPVRIVGTCSAGPLPLGDPGDSLFWTFGEGASIKKIHTPASVTEYSISYLKPGMQNFSVAFVRKPVNGAWAYWSGTVRVQPSPDVRLGPDTAVCTAAAVAVRIAPRTPLPVGSTLRWIDGSQGPSLTVTAPGTYWVDVTDPATGCTTHVSRTIRARADCGAGGSSGSGSGSGSGTGTGSGGSVAGPVGGFVPNIVTPNADSQNDAFQLIDLVAADWQLQVFNRWGREVFRQEHYDNGWAAADQPAGIYYYLLRHAPSGQLRRGWVEVLK